MPKFDARDASCHVFTFKEGALSALAHDLEIVVERFTIEVTGEASDAGTLAVDARFEPGSLKVLHAMKDGQPHGGLSDSDKRKIEKQTTDTVLEPRRYPEIRFHASKITPAGDGFTLAGELTLHGKTRPLEVRTRRDGDRQVAEVTLHQPDFGIKPFSAMLGTLKIKPDLRIRVTVPWSSPG